MTQAVKEKKRRLQKLKNHFKKVHDISRLYYLFFENCELCVQILKYIKYTNINIYNILRPKLN